jgi:N-acetylneuraminate synthase
MITNVDFVKKIADKKKYTYISTGMSDYKNIDEAVKIFKLAKCEFELMHSVSAYPCPEDQLNLHLIKKLKEKYECKVGYSGHEPSVSPSIVAVCLGASSIERHITLDRSMYGSDQAASLEKKGLEELVSVIRKIPIVFGDKDKRIFECEIEVAKKLRYWER